LVSSLFPKRSFSFDSKSNAISNSGPNHLETLSDLHVGRLQDKLTSEDFVESKRPFLFGIKIRVYRKLGILHRKERDVCEQCGEKFAEYEDLIKHARHIHQHPIVKCHECGKEFIHEKDRLHHVREENAKKAESREHKNLH
jgi:DNA-directed RNA polymerase subunit RPC12/RpoP